MTHRVIRRGCAAGALAGLALGLLGCVPLDVADPGATSPQPTPRAAVPEPSQASRDLMTFYTRYEQRQLTSGLLRTDGGGVDTPYTARQLAENFERIALFDEYTLRGGRFVAQQTESRLRRWKGPVRIRPAFGRSVSEAQKTRDRAELETYVARLARVTGADIRTSVRGANYHVLFLNIDELRAAGPILRDLVPDISDAIVRDITEMDRLTFCSVYAISDSETPNDYETALAIIRAEHPDLLRQGCIHEEIAQGLGLANDSRDARPSIFNDDDEFALLTSHDEQLLRILYDARLTPGLTPDEARPLVQQIAAERMGGGS
ncbi:MAG: DUF2927 domain-containing protein [Pseudomonadota bacterium]